MRSRHVLKGGSFDKLYRTTMSAFTKLNKGFDLFSISDIVNGCSNIVVSKKSFFYWTSILSHLENRTILHILLQWWNVINWTYFIWPICDQWERYVFDLSDYNAKARWISLRLRYFPVGHDKNPMKSRTFLPNSIGNY